MLDLLDRFQARATFFVIGSRAEEYPHLITEILSRGHEIANHTYTHPSGTFWAAGPIRIAARDRSVRGNVADGTGSPRAIVSRSRRPEESCLFTRSWNGAGSPLSGGPSGDWTPCWRNPDRVAARILRETKPGAIILLHEAHRVAKNPEFNPLCLELTLNGLAERGYRCVIPAPEQLRTSAAGK